MSDRLNELLRQRALIQDHLSWLDRQIIAESNGLSPLAPSPAELDSLEKGKIPLIPGPANFTTNSTAEASRTEQAAEVILADYKKDPVLAQSDVKRGCLLYFIGALAFVSLVVLVFYFFYSRRHVQEREQQKLGAPARLESR